MKVMVIGLGSVGSRHLANLRALRPDAQIIAADPDAAARERVGMHCAAYADWRMALARERPEAAIIASPTVAHLEQAGVLADARIPFLLEKPVCSVWQADGFAQIVRRTEARGLRCAVGHQYRFAYPRERMDAWREAGFVAFAAQDDLVRRYGEMVSETMAAHPIDLALRILGKPLSVHLHDDGVRFSGWVEHERGLSAYALHAGRGPRRSRVVSWDDCVDAPAGNEMYLAEMGAWLDYVETGKHDGTLATLADGLAVMRVLEEVKGCPK